MYTDKTYLLLTVITFIKTMGLVQCGYKFWLHSFILIIQLKKLKSIMVQIWTIKGFIKMYPIF